MKRHKKQGKEKRLTEQTVLMGLIIALINLLTALVNLLTKLFE